MISHQTRRQHWTIVLSIVFLALATVIATLIYQDRQEQNAGFLINEPISSIQIAREGFTSIDLLKRDDRWKILRPCPMEASSERLTPLIATLQQIKSSYSADEVDLQAAGLNNPVALLTINETALRLGGPDASGERRYIMSNGQVSFVPAWIASYVQSGLSALIRPDVFSGPITQMEMHAGDDTSANRVINPVERKQWQTLTANQIVNWPLPAAYNDTKKHTRKLTWQSSGGQPQATTIDIHDNFAAIRQGDAACAFIVTIDQLPPL